MSFVEFRAKVLKNRSKRGAYKINNSIDARDIYRWAKKNKLIDSTVTESTFSKVVKFVHQEMLESLYKGKKVYLPNDLGVMEIVRVPVFVKIVDGKVVTNRKVDWGTTLKLWYEDKEAYQNKTLVRTTSNYIYSVLCKKRRRYPQKHLWSFSPSITIKKELKKRLDKDTIDIPFLCNTPT